MPSTTRTFVAIEIPSALSEALARLQTQLGPEVPDARWIGRGNFHVTLAFLGDVNDRDLDRLGRAVGEAVAPFEPFALRLEGLGAFPEPGRPRSFWAGLAGEALDRLKELQRAVSQAVASVGYPPSDDRFSPHVTLARIKTDRGRPPDLTPLLRQHEGWSAGPFTVAEVITFASELRPDGPRYTPLAQAPLRGGKSETPP